MQRITPGDIVRDRLTGLVGTVVGRFEWRYGCVRISVQPAECKDGKPADAVAYDEGQLDVVQAQAHPYEPPTYQKAQDTTLPGPDDAGRARPGTGGPPRDTGHRADPTR